MNKRISPLDKFAPGVNRRFTMKYTKEERLNIGRRIYDGELSRYAAAEEYSIGEQTARNYMRMYRASNYLPPKHNQQNSHSKAVSSAAPSGLEDYEAMTKEDLIRELVKSRIAQARLKKGYEVKGVGAEKEFVRLDSKNTK